PRDPPAPAVEPVALTLQAQQSDFTFDLGTALISHDSTVQQITGVPGNCQDFTSECPTAFQTYNVTYDDCGDTWTICRCTAANMTLDTAVERLGQVPVGLRRYVGTILLSPDLETHAYTLTSGDIHMFGDTQVDTWVHEAAHAYDWATGSPLSGSPDWTEAIGNDTCVPDTYSQTSVGEDFAQMTVMKIFSMVYGNSLPTGWTMDCMSHQMQYMSSLPLFNQDTLFGNTCAIVPSDPYSRHSTPPAEVASRVQPNYAPQPQSSTLLPVVAAASNSSTSVPGTSTKDNAAIS
ncbi:hypothetical protein H0H93_009669, partial [Arthromyces matolae]